MGRQKRNETKEEYNARMAEYMRIRYHKTMEWYNAYKVEQGCKDCGWNKHHAGLEADHLIPRNGNTQKTIASMATRGVGVLQRELEFCDIVCATCHNMRTWKRKNGLLKDNPLEK